MATAAVGALHAVMGIDTSAFDAGLKKAQAKVAGLDISSGIKAGVADIRRSLSSAAGATGAFGAALGGLGIAGVAAAAAIGLAFVETRKALAFGDDIADTAKRLAVSTDTLQEYRFAVHALGGEYEDADAALEGFAKTFGLAQTGYKKAVAVFKTLKLDPKSFATTEDALQAVIEKIHGLSSTAQQAAIADKLGLSPMLSAIRDGGSAIDDLRERAHALGYVMDKDLVERAGDANDKFEDLERILDVQFKSTMVELAPIILGVAQALATAAKFAAGLARGLDKIQLADVSSALGLGRLPGALLDARKAQANLTHARANMRRKGDAGPGALGGAANLVSLPKTGGGRHGRSASQVAGASEDAIARAAQGELSARMALTKDIAALAVLRAAEVEAETQAANDRLTRDAAEGQITKAAAERAIALNNATAAARQTAIAQEADAAALDDEVRLRDEVNGYYDEIARIEADLAGTAAERAAIEDKALAARQASEARTLADQNALDVATGAITESRADELKASQRDLHAAQRRATADEHAAALADEDARRRDAAASLALDLLDAQKLIARTATERAQLEVEILKIQQDEERARLEAVLASKQVAALDKEIARRRLDALGSIHGAQSQAAQQDVFAAQLQDAGDMISQFAQSFDSGTANKIAAGFQHVAQAFAQGGPVFAAMAAIGEIGNAVGGGFGAFLSGFGSGGILGGVVSLIGHNKAKKKKKKAAAAAAKAEAEQKAAELAAAKRELELHIMELSGDEAGALAERRKDELAAMDASLRPLKEREYQLEDEAAAAEKAAAAVAHRQDLELQFLRESGQDAAALAIERAKALAAENDADRALLQRIYDVIDANKAREAAEKALADATAAANDNVDKARSEVEAALARQSAELEDQARHFGELADALHAAGEALKGSGLVGPRGLAAARANFERVFARVQAGDAGALDELQGVTDAFVEASKGGAKSAAENARNVALARKALAAGEALARTQVDVAHQQLDALTQLVANSGIQIEVEKGLTAALADYSNAMFNLASVQAQGNQQLYDLAQAALARSDAASGLTAAADAAAAAAAVDVASPGSTVDLSVVADQLATLITATERGVVNTGQALRLYKRWDGDGLPAERDIAA